MKLHTTNKKIKEATIIQKAVILQQKSGHKDFTRKLIYDTFITTIKR